MKNIIIIKNNNAMFKEDSERGCWCLITHPHQSEKVRVCFSVKEVYRNFRKGRTLILSSLFFTRREVEKLFENLKISHTIPMRKGPFNRIEEDVMWLKDCAFSHNNRVENGYMRHTFKVEVYDDSDCFNPMLIRTIKCPNEKVAQKISTMLAWQYEANAIIHEKQFVETNH